MTAAMTDLLTRAASDAFLDVGVVLALVALVVLAVGDRCARVAGVLERHPALGPVVGGLLGVSPGCSGALLMAPLYASGRVSPGTMAATLIATTGDSAWAMWAGAPGAAAVVHAVTLLTGITVGLLVDATPLAKLLRPSPRPSSAVAAELVTDAVPTGLARGARGPVSTLLRPGRVVALVPLMAVFWLATGAGAAWALGVSPPAPGTDPVVGGTQQLAGLLGFTACVLLLLRARGRGPVVVPATGAPRVMALLERASTQAAFVVVWVGAAYLVLGLLEAVVGTAASTLQLSDPVAVLVGTLVGALPGCGLQIAWTGLYLDGVVGLPGLLANALAQDGDALLPLLVVQRRAALTLTVATSVPALALGTVAALLL